ncbi:MAG: tRNA dihydrouridine synthase DusB [Ruminococcus sp.]|jgi:nifR3 family TIM-barrel protein|nr:tRNA dihydrouridine synthase DusB [Ruminococcus sp.]
MNIKTVKIQKMAALSPMASVADTAYRTICKQFGASYTVSEMVSVKGLFYNFGQSSLLCNITEVERPMAIQLFGAEPEFFEKAAKSIEIFSPDIIDINMGCPVKKVVGTGAGAALMKNIPLASDIVKAVISASNSPVTVKFRSGYDEVNAEKFADAMEKAGADAMCIHPRLRREMYSGKSDWNIIKAIKKNSSVPIIGSGDVKTLEDCLEMYEKTGCDLVSIGRGSYGNPFLFAKIKAYFDKTPYTPPSSQTILNTMVSHIKMISNIKEARKVAAWYIKDMRNAAYFRRKCYEINSHTDAENLAEEILSNLN